MLTLDVAALLGSSICEGLHVTCLLPLPHEGLLVVGTNAGCVLAFAPNSTAVLNNVTINNNNNSETAVDSSSSSCTGLCVYAQTLHNGPVNSLSVTTTAQLLASAGHDAAPVVQPITNLFSNSGVDVRRLRGHTLPITDVSFFSSGIWLASCNVGGRFIVFDIPSHRPICDVRVGFSIRCLALGPDETTCFVAGTQIARIDLYDKDRPAEPLSRRDAPLWLQHYTWQCDNSDEENNNEVVVMMEVPDDLFIAKLSLTADTLTAFFLFRKVSNKNNSKNSSISTYINNSGGAIATWIHSAGEFWLSRDFKYVDKFLTTNEEIITLQYYSSSCFLFSSSSLLFYLPFRQIFLETAKEAGALPLLRARDGWDTWIRPHIRVESLPSLRVKTEVAKLNRCDNISVDKLFTETSDILKSRLDSEEERGRMLQAECDDLVHRLKTRMQQSGKKRKRVSAMA